ncbi:MAG: M15 family metallopeptidase [Neisseria sp.]|nr:M15 family metallopeptidase [Neisseria sp.]
MITRQNRLLLAAAAVFLLLIGALFKLFESRNPEPEYVGKPAYEDEQTDARPSEKTASETGTAATESQTGLDELTGRLTPAEAGFRLLPAQYSNKDSYVRAAIWPDLLAMLRAAEADGIRLEVVSAFRSYDRQNGIWSRKWQSAKGSDSEKVLNIMRYSALPGLSRHHWGTDIDFNSVEYPYWEKPQGKKTLAWLRANAKSYGFCEVYSGKSEGRRKGGYEDEPWHWSHFETAEPLQQRTAAAVAQIVKLPVKGQKAIAEMQPKMKQYVTSLAACR